VALDPSGNSTREEIAGASVPESVRGTVLSRGAPLLLRRGARDASSRALAVDGVRDAAWVPLKGDMGVIGYLSVTNRQGEVRGFDREDLLILETVAAHTAIALEKGRLIDQLRYEATHDGLTGLPNRAMFSAAAGRAIEQADDRRVAVMIMDLDGFKEVNETLGHEEGDVSCARWPTGCVRPRPMTCSSRGSVATSSPCCCATSSTPTRHASWPGGCWSRSSSPCDSRTSTSRSAPRSESPSDPTTPATSRGC
jgi:hypothetical protein